MERKHVLLLMSVDGGYTEIVPRQTRSYELAHTCGELIYTHVDSEPLREPDSLVDSHRLKLLDTIVINMWDLLKFQYAHERLFG